MPGVDVTNNILANFAKFINGVDPDDPEYLREVMRPAEIKEDVRLMEQRKRVSLILQSVAFRRQLDSIISSQLSACENPSVCHPGLRFSQGSASPAAASVTPSAAAPSAKGPTSLIPINDLRLVPTVYSEMEQQYRCKLASLYRLIDLLGWSTSIYNHISVRIRREGDEVLVNPFGLLYHEVTAGSLLKVDMKGNVLDPGCTRMGLDAAGWKLHSTVLGANSKIRCVIHLTTPAVVAVSRTADRLLPLSREAIVVGHTVFLDSVASAEGSDGGDASFGGLELGQQQKLKAVLAPSTSSPGGSTHGIPRIVFLRGSGLLAIGSTVEEAWFYASNAVHACEAQLSLSSVSADDLWLPSSEECEELRHDLLPSVNESPNSPHTPRSPRGAGGDSGAPVEWRVGEMEFEALMRHLDNAGFRTGYCYRSTGAPYGLQLGADATDAGVKGSPKKGHSGSKPRRDRTDVEIPPIAASVDMERPAGTSPTMRKSTPYWMTSPNQYLRLEYDNGGDATDGGEESADDQLMLSSGDEGGAPSSVASDKRKKTKRKTHWVTTSDVGMPLKSSTLPLMSAAESAPNKYAPQGGNPKEYKENQRKVRDKYYQDVNTAGPRSRLLEGLTLEELMMLKREGLAKESEDGMRLILMAATSKGIIDKEHRHDTPWLSTTVVASNPFQHITDEELQKYTQEIEIKSNPALAHLLKEQEERLEQERRLQEQREREKAAAAVAAAAAAVAAATAKEAPVTPKTATLAATAPTSTSTTEVSVPATRTAPPPIIIRTESTKRDVAASPHTPVSSSTPVGAKPSTSATPPTSSRLAALKSDTSGAEASYDDTEKEGTDTGGDSKEKKKKRRFKMPSFSRKKK